jgi:hypothetical protein
MCLVSEWKSEVRETERELSTSASKAGRAAQAAQNGGSVGSAEEETF